MKMKLTCLILCLSGVKSQFLNQAVQEPTYYVNPLSAIPGQIIFEKEAQYVDLSTDQATNTGQYAKPINTSPPFEVQRRVEQTTILNAPVQREVNSNIPNREPINLGQNAAALNSNSWNQNQVVHRQNGLIANQNEPVSSGNTVVQPNKNPVANPNENINFENLDLSVLTEGASQSKVENENSPPKQSDTQQIQGVFGPSPADSSPQFVKPRIEGIGEVITQFGLSLLKTLINQREGNTVISPLSISTSLALLQQGARGKTQSQISNALQLKPEDARTYYGALSNDIKRRNSRNILVTANNLFLAKYFVLNPTFSEAAESVFKSSATNVDYTQPAKAANEINKWVSKQTREKIKEIVSPNFLGYATQMTLVNAVYFKGIWNIVFNENKTKMREFKLSNGQKKSVPFMRSRRNLRGGVDPATRIMSVVIPFENDEYSLMCILPPETSTVNDVINTLTVGQLMDFRSFPAQEFDLEIPKFTIRADTDLKPLLINMGLGEMFTTFTDLSGIGENNIYNVPLQLSSAIHSAVLSIDEQGGTGAATTAFGAVALSYELSLKFRADRPFLVVLWDNASAAPIFMVKVMDPVDQAV